jgi:hypothetical protein
MSNAKSIAMQSLEHTKDLVKLEAELLKNTHGPGTTMQRGPPGFSNESNAYRTVMANTAELYKREKNVLNSLSKTGGRRSKQSKRSKKSRRSNKRKAKATKRRSRK